MQRTETGPFCQVVKFVSEGRQLIAYHLTSLSGGLVSFVYGGQGVPQKCYLFSPGTQICMHGMFPTGGLFRQSFLE